MCILWKDGSTSWEPLKDLKESNPLEVAEYAACNHIATEPAFTWWVPFALKRRDCIIKTMRTCYQRKWQKYGIKIPIIVQCALRIHQETGNDFWQKALQLESWKIFLAVQILNEDARQPVRYQEIPCHIFFDIKMDFTHKARYVAGGHKTEASVVSHDSIRIRLLMASLNNLDILSADIAGAYLNAPCLEKVYTRCGLEFGPENKGQIAIIMKVLYGLKSSAFAWREHLASTLRDDLHYQQCRADNDVWIHPTTKPNGHQYCMYTLTTFSSSLINCEK